MRVAADEPLAMEREQEVVIAAVAASARVSALPASAELEEPVENA